MEGAPLAEVKSAVDVDLGGVLGAGLLSVFRVTFGDDGRWMWIEPDPVLTAPPQLPTGPREGGPPRPSTPSPAPTPTPAPGKSPPPKGTP
jgi:hypothetical protein